MILKKETPKKPPLSTIVPSENRSCKGPSLELPEGMHHTRSTSYYDIIDGPHCISCCKFEIRIVPEDDLRWAAGSLVEGPR